MTMFSSIWFLASAMFVATAGTAAIAFQHSPDRSAFAIVNWTIIAASLVTPLLLIPGLLSPKSHEDAATRRGRCARVVILLYLPLASALSLLAFGRR
jgi:hypothetical protein